VSVAKGKERVDVRREVASAVGIEDVTMHAPPIHTLHLPWQVTPIEPTQKGANLDIFQALMVLTDQPAPTGLALFSSQQQWPVYPAVQIAFPRLQMGESYLVEFHLYLISDTTYQFRVFDFPLDGYEDISIPGGQSHIVTHLVPPADSIPEEDNLYFGAMLQQRNPEEDQAAWYFYAAQINPED
jgi:hypothetical protein